MNCNLSLIPVTATPPEFKQSLNPGGVFYTQLILNSKYIILFIIFAEISQIL